VFPELAAALEMIVFPKGLACERVRTKSHVERLNHKLR
jgi:hypothetical protein